MTHQSGLYTGSAQSAAAHSYHAVRGKLGKTEKERNERCVTATPNHCAMPGNSQAARSLYSYLLLLLAAATTAVAIVLMLSTLPEEQLSHTGAWQLCESLQ
jgi:hypothetical protein